MPLTDTSGEREQADLVAETHDKLIAVGVDRATQLFVFVGGEPALVEQGIVGSFDAYFCVGISI